MTGIDYKKLTISIAIPLIAALIGSIFTNSSVGSWFKTITKPWFSPPDWLFGPVWTILFILMGISLYLVWNTKSSKKINAISVFGIQLALNIAWSGLFFGMQEPAYAFIEIIILWVAIAANILYFRVISKTAAYLLLPYILWVTFAVFLNYNIMILN